MARLLGAAISVGLLGLSVMGTPRADAAELKLAQSALPPIFKCQKNPDSPGCRDNGKKAPSQKAKGEGPALRPLEKKSPSQDGNRNSQTQQRLHQELKKEKASREHKPKDEARQPRPEQPAPARPEKAREAPPASGAAERERKRPEQRQRPRQEAQPGAKPRSREFDGRKRPDERRDNMDRRPQAEDRRPPDRKRDADGRKQRDERANDRNGAADKSQDRDRNRRKPDKDRALEYSVPIPGVNGRVIIRNDGNVTVRSNDEDRFDGRRGERDVRKLSGGRTQTVIRRPNGSAVITVRDRDGDIVRRVRRTRDGREIVLIDNDRVRRDERPLRLPPLRVDIPRDRYIVEGEAGRRPMIEEALRAGPVERVERPYSLYEIRRNERLRAKMRRVDLSLTFAFDSAAIPGDQYDQLEAIGVSIQDELARDPAEVFLVEGHTDAPGSYDYNLRLSDARAESVAIALSDYFAIPPENLVTQGYGEEYLKIDTLERERRNRRVTIRRITPLLEGSR
ncbi:OmpA family protein [Breoghania corrubedonensis]|nr:OmpA family protein [Breoghania corrubedonensis]